MYMHMYMSSGWLSLPLRPSSASRFVFRRFAISGLHSLSSVFRFLALVSWPPFLLPSRRFGQRGVPKTPLSVPRAAAKLPPEKQLRVSSCRQGSKSAIPRLKSRPLEGLGGRRTAAKPGTSLSGVRASCMSVSSLKICFRLPLNSILRQASRNLEIQNELYVQLLENNE